MVASLVERPRLALATAIAIVAAVAVVAALFPNPSGTGLPPSYANEPHGRQFVAIGATERGEHHSFAHPLPTFSFGFGDAVGIYTGCNDLGTRWKLKDSRFVVSGGGMTMVLCTRRGFRGEMTHVGADQWMLDFLDHRPTWQLAGNTLKLRSDFGTMTLVDKGDGRDPADILDGRFFVGHRSEAHLAKAARRFRPNVWIHLSINPDGLLRASFACQRVEVAAEIAPGTLEVTDEIKPRPQPCSAGMREQDTEWFWQLLRQPLRWRSLEGRLTLASETDQVSLVDGVEESVRVHPDDLRNKAFRSVDIEGPNTEEIGIDDGRGLTFEVDEAGVVAARIDCDRPTVRAKAHIGWLRSLPAETAQSDCTSSPAEAWLADLFADEPYWRLTRGRLVIRSDQTRIELFPKAGNR